MVVIVTRSTDSINLAFRAVMRTRAPDFDWNRRNREGRVAVWAYDTETQVHLSRSIVAVDQESFVCWVGSG